MKKSMVILALLLSEPLRLVYFSRMGLSTDWLLGITVLLSLLMRPSRAVLIGFALGAGRDLLYGDPVGFEAMAFSMAAWFVGMAGRTVYREAFTTQVIVIFLVSLGYGSALYLRATGALDGVFPYLWRSVIPGAVLPSLVIPSAFAGVRRLTRPKLSDELEALLKESQFQGGR